MFGQMSADRRTIGAAYAGFFVIWIAYSLMAFGVNARAALAAMEEEKIKEEPPES